MFLLEKIKKYQMKLKNIIFNLLYLFKKLKLLTREEFPKKLEEINKYEDKKNLDIQNNEKLPYVPEEDLKQERGLI